jgi:aspartyl-tRNA(Asn)/glutamyl-tRNA(Gln) amidotransferase subunit A
MSELIWTSASEQRDLLDRKEVSAVELATAHLERMSHVEPALFCHLHRMDDVALKQAAAADARIADGSSGPMTGIPVSLKDVLVTTDAPTTAASKILQGYMSPFDATVVSKLREAGAVFVGKSNTDEFAMGSSCCWGGASFSWIRHGRVNSPTGRVLRGGRPEANLRQSLPVWAHCIRE